MTDRIDLLQSISDGGNDKIARNWDDIANKIIDYAKVEMDKKYCCNVISEEEIKRGKLHFLIGLQRSGKSTWATHWMRKKPIVKDGIVFPRAVVCADNIRLAVTGQRYNRRAESTVFMIKQYMIETLLSRGHYVLVDGTHTTETSIRRILEIDRDATWTIINTPVAICKKRAMETNQPDLVPVLDRTNQQMKKLLDEGIDNVINRIKSAIYYRQGKIQ